jgi:preprotein translocase subunit Sec61beta
MCMAKKAGGRLISSAGLVNYYESTDRRAIQISPYAVAVVAAAIGMIVFLLDVFY